MSPHSDPIVVAPFSNSDTRNWPIGHYAALIGLLIDRLGGTSPIRVIGTANQKLPANEIVRAYPVDRVRNDCGRLSWGETVRMLKTARCVIGNNSSIAHLGGRLGVPTVCVFGGSHQRMEWHPLGASVILVSHAIGCSPCQLDHGHSSPYDKACLRWIAPEVVADACRTIIDRSAARSGGVMPMLMPAEGIA